MGREAADEYCSYMHLAKAILGTAGEYEIPQMLGFPDLDNWWCTTWGEDVPDLFWCTTRGEDLTDLFEISSLCFVQSGTWTINGWILDDYTMQALKEEFPDECPDIPEHLAVSWAIGAMAVQSPLYWRLPTGHLKLYSPRLRSRSRGSGPAVAMFV